MRPADLAVLVRKNERGEAIREALVAAGVPAVMHGASSVFASTMAQDWLTLLSALEQPRQQAVRQAALTCFFGWDFVRLAEADDAELTELSQRVRGWSRLLAGRGVAALLEAAITEERVPERLLREVGGARRLTDLRHLAQSLHGAMTAGQLGVGALIQWLRERMAEARGSALTDGTRRLETDAHAVTILTVHRSKGLEFPIVYLPEIWDRHVDDKDEGRVLKLHEPDRSGSGGQPRRLRARRRRAAQRRTRRTIRPPPGRGRRRGPPAGLRRPDPGPVPGRVVVGRVLQHPGIGRAAVPVPGDGDGLGRHRARLSDRGRRSVPCSTPGRALLPGTDHPPLTRAVAGCPPDGDGEPAPSR